MTNYFQKLIFIPAMFHFMDLTFTRISHKQSWRQWLFAVIRNTPALSTKSLLVIDRLTAATKGTEIIPNIHRRKPDAAHLLKVGDFQGYYFSGPFLQVILILYICLLKFPLLKVISKRIAAFPLLSKLHPFLFQNFQYTYVVSLGNHAPTKK